MLQNSQTNFVSSEHSHIESCCKTGLSICRRMFNINLALGYTDEFYSLKALSEMHNKSMDEMFDFALDYIFARDCFSKEWRKMKDPNECPLASQCVKEKCFKS